MNKEILEYAQHCASGERFYCSTCQMMETQQLNCSEAFAKAIVEQFEKYRWHNLIKNPDDLPDDYGEYLVAERWSDGSIAYSTASFVAREECWDSVIIAWREIDPVEIN